jgi:hypothetical protein
MLDLLDAENIWKTSGAKSVVGQLFSTMYVSNLLTVQTCFEMGLWSCLLQHTYDFIFSNYVLGRDKAFSNRELY